MKRASCILGMMLSLVIIVYGISTFFSADEFFVMSGTKFGADFYTEIFEEVEQVKASTRSIDNAIYRVGGLLLISIGGISLFGFLNLLSDTFDKKLEKGIEDQNKGTEDKLQVK